MLSRKGKSVVLSSFSGFLLFSSLAFSALISNNAFGTSDIPGTAEGTGLQLPSTGTVASPPVSNGPLTPPQDLLDVHIATPELTASEVETPETNSLVINDCKKVQISGGVSLAPNPYCLPFLFTFPPLEGEIGGEDPDWCIFVCPDPQGGGGVGGNGGTPESPPDDRDSERQSDRERYCSSLGISGLECYRSWKDLVCRGWSEQYCQAGEFLREGCELRFAFVYHIVCSLPPPGSGYGAPPPPGVCYPRLQTCSSPPTPQQQALDQAMDALERQRQREALDSALDQAMDALERQQREALRLALYDAINELCQRNPSEPICTTDCPFLTCLPPTAREADPTDPPRPLPLPECGDGWKVLFCLANDVKSIYLPGSDIVVPTASKFPILYDSDGDGVADDWDNCPDVYNPGQENTDGDEKGDLCEDEI